MLYADGSRGGRPRRIIPALGGLYDALAPLALPMIRLTAGLLLLPHGCQKLFGWFGGKGMQGTADYFASSGFEPGYFWALAVALTEVGGGLCLALGFLTRPAAAAIAGFMAVAVVQAHWPKGFFWTSGGFEYPLLWGVVALAFVILGGGRYSVDRWLGREF
ncbi:MAG: DoxX family protein [Rhodospirillales bacterium]